MTNPLTDKLDELEKLCDNFDRELAECPIRHEETLAENMNYRIREAMPKLIKSLRVVDKNLDRIAASDNEVARWATRAKKEIQQILCGGEG